MPVLELGGFTIIVVVLSILSGVGSYLQGVRDERLKGGVLDFLTEVVLSLVVGLIVSSLCVHYKVTTEVTHALVLISSNNGAETIAFLRELAKTKLTKGQGK